MTQTPILLVVAGALLLGPGAAPALAQPAQPTQSATCPDDLEILVERAYAARAGLAVGDSLRLGPDPTAECHALVAGTFEPPADPATLTRERPRLLLHLPDLARLPDGCVFRPRCDRPIGKCSLERPELTGGEHCAACHVARQ